ncbi:MAG: Crp/Fnr family transcriptional regulator [Pseudomonadota bacterium]
MEHGKGDPFDTLQGGNYLLDSLPQTQRDDILAQCERVTLEAGTVLCEAGEPFTQVYFPLTGTISVVRDLPGREPFETENIGREGMLGAALILDVNRAPQRGIVQTPCVTWRMEAHALQAALHDHAELSRILQRYLYVAVDDLSQSTGCIRFHDVGQRLARGLLLAQDRTRTDDLPMTHQLLADMLGVQRGAVTIAAIKLQREGIIRYSRGRITILDREELKARSCECYGASVENHANILP